MFFFCESKADPVEQNQNKYTNAKIKGSMVPLIQKFIYDKDQSALRVGVYGL